jgi:hypothetical protein
MRRNKWVRVVGVALMAAAVLSIFGSVVMGLWNWLMPTIFKLPVLTFWQANGLLALSWIFFGSWRGFHGHGHHHWRGARRMRRQWARMTPEQREEFRRAMRGRCHHRSEAPAGDANKLLPED